MSVASLNPKADDVCAWENEPCNEPAVATVRTILGPRDYCQRHTAYVRMVEREWDRAEAEHLEQF